MKPYKGPVFVQPKIVAELKAELKRVKANTKCKLKNALQRVYAKIILGDIRGRFRHCDYSVRRTFKSEPL